MVQTIGRCHVPLLKIAKTFAFFWKYDKRYYDIYLLDYLNINKSIAVDN